VTAAAKNVEGSSSEDAKAFEGCRCQNCNCVSCGQPFGRRGAVLIAGALGALSDRREANAEQLILQTDRCLNCNGEGFIPCVNCQGTGQFKMLSFNDGNPSGQYQYVDCPDCQGAGNRVCEKCVGTGLPLKKVRGFMRDPDFRKVLGELKGQGVTLNTLPQIKKDVQEAIRMAEERKAAAAAGAP